MRVLMKESHPEVSARLQHLMEDYHACKIIVYADTGKAIAAATQLDEPVDLMIFGMHTDEVGDMKRLLAATGTPREVAPLLVLSELHEPLYAPLCIAAGAKGFVPAGEPEDAWLAAVKAILLGGIYVSRGLARQPIMRQIATTGHLNVLNLLSYREREIAEYLVKDTPIREISCQLNLTDDAVLTHQENILMKLHLTQLSDLKKLVDISAD